MMSDLRFRISERDFVWRPLPYSKKQKSDIRNPK